MLTPDQEAWLAHLSDRDRIRILPFDPNAADAFAVVKHRIETALGQTVRIEHHGATSLGISGQDEIDVYLPVPADRLNDLIDRLRALFGEPRSLYPGRRARFVTEVDGKHIDVFPINEEHEDWGRMARFEAYLRSHPEALEQYRLLKERGNGLSVRAYYREKLRFFNDVLERAASAPAMPGA
jgi:GrpB-like predicted nucleotidyltransferase (UPF0157 family)